MRSSHPLTAKAFVTRVRDRVRTLSTLPYATVPVEETGTSTVRELYVGNYRIMFRIGDDVIHVVAVLHGARLFDEKRLDEERP